MEHFVPKAKLTALAWEQRARKLLQRAATVDSAKRADLHARAQRMMNTARHMWANDIHIW
jgi:hypothetical protein